MGKPLPLEMRRAIVRMAQKTETSQAEIARLFKVGERSVKRYMALYRQTGDVDSHTKFGGHKKAVLSEHETMIKALLSGQPDITLASLQETLKKEKIEIGTTAIFMFLKACGYSYKKNGIRSRAEAQGRGGTARGMARAAKKS